MLQTRRSLIAALSTAVAARSGAAFSLLEGGGTCAFAGPASGALAALCSDLRCPPRVAAACLRALSTADASLQRLSMLILTDVYAAAGEWPSASAMQRAVRDKSRADFSEGKIITVDGWLLSQIETRVYALSGLLNGSEVQHPVHADRSQSPTGELQSKTGYPTAGYVSDSR